MMISSFYDLCYLFQGLADVLIGDQPSLSVISKGADCLLINKQFYLEHATEKLLRDVRQNVRISVLIGDQPSLSVII